MIATGLCIPSTVVAGRAADAVTAYLAAAGAGTVLLVLDPRARRSHAARLLEAGLAAAGVTRHVRLVSAAPTLEAAAQLGAFARSAAIDTVVGFGGGTVLDTAKLVAAAGALEDAPDDDRGVLDLHGARELRLVLVPTTFGTASETSAVALVHAPGRRRLARGRALQPDLAVIDPSATADLPAPVALSGAAEVVLRALGPRLMDRSSIGLADDVALLLARRALTYGLRLERSGALEARERADLSVVSLATASIAMAGRSVFAYRLWYFATSLAAALDTSKMQAMGLLTGPYLGAVAAGRVRAADDAREVLREACRPLGRDASAPELAATLARWSGPPPARGLSREELASCVRKHWCWPDGPLAADDLDALADWCPSTINPGVIT